MKKIILACAIFASAVFSFAQDATLKSVCTQLSKNAITKGDFVQSKTIAKNGRTLKSSGKYIFTLEGIAWNTEKPFSSSLVLKSDSMIQISAEGKKTVTDASGNETFKSIASTLTSVFTGKEDDLLKNFECNFSTDGSLWTVELSPRDKTVASMMKKIVLCGTVEKTEITSIELSEASGDVVMYAFQNSVHPKDLTDEEKTCFSEK